MKALEANLKERALSRYLLGTLTTRSSCVTFNRPLIPDSTPKKRDATRFYFKPNNLLLLNGTAFRRSEVYRSLSGPARELGRSATAACMTEGLTPPTDRQADWARLAAGTRFLLLACYFAEGVGLACLASFFSDAGWPVRVGIAAACLLPYGLLWRVRPDLQIYLPGPLLTLFGLFLGMLPGWAVEIIAEKVGAAPEVAKGLFVVVTAVGMAAVVRLAYRRPAGAAGIERPAERVTAAERPRE